MATANFTDAELGCRCECGGLPTWEFQQKLQQLRERYGRPMVLNSAYRCPAYNASVSKTGRNGPHTKGAVDVRVSDGDVYDLLKAAIELGWYGIGPDQKGDRGGRFLHLDRRPPDRRTVWTYD